LKTKKKKGSKVFGTGGGRAGRPEANRARRFPGGGGRAENREKRHGFLDRAGPQAPPKNAHGVRQRYSKHEGVTLRDNGFGGTGARD